MKTWRFAYEKSGNFGKKGLQNRIVHDIIPRVSTIRRTDIGMSPSGKAPDFDSGISSVQIRPSQPYDPLAQQAEQLPFKQWVRGSNPRRVTKKADTMSGICFFAVVDSKINPNCRWQFGARYNGRANHNACLWAGMERILDGSPKISNASAFGIFGK